MRLLFIAVLGTLACLPGGERATAVEYRLAHTFQRANPEPGDLFGTSVVLENGVAAIKSDSGRIDGDGLSVTHVFEQNPSGGWDEAATFEFDSGDNRGNVYIGQELAIDEGEVVIGYSDYFEAGGSFTPLQFARRDAPGWSIQRNQPEEYLLLSPEERRAFPSGETPFKFALPGSKLGGRTVDISGDFAIAEDSEARKGASSRSSRGVARIYERGDDGLWREVANLTRDDDFLFGAYSVAIDGTTAAVARGVRRSDPPEIATVLFFERQASGEWVETQGFRNFDDDLFASLQLVEVDGDTAVTSHTSTGDITVYERREGEWVLEAELPSETDSILPGFALEGDLIARTTQVDADSDLYRVDLYRRTAPGEWSLLTSIHDPAPEPGRTFGASLALDQGRLLIGTTSVLSTNDYLFTPGRSAVPAGQALLFVPVPEPTGVSLLLGPAAYLLRRRRS